MKDNVCATHDFGAEGGVRPFPPGWRPGLAPWATIFRPYGARRWAAEQTTYSTNF